jgi:predicted nucleic acid-binding protein
VVVVDASVVIGATSPDEGSPNALSLLARAFEAGAISPALFAYEVENVLLVKERRQAFSSSDRQRTSDVIASLPIDIRAVDPERVRNRIASLATRTGLSVYDAAYLDLAIEIGAPLATLDRRLSASARAEGVELLLP